MNNLVRGYPQMTGSLVDTWSAMLGLHTKE
nr:MAG TPA: hypothetical protein [Caudoviricetes sp.]DAN09379.1 MAG TPA: hypothetical protein [Caudoviricetes sp.]DAZ34102.1 MAG TPA: hypothetical protein [Caudoviricetes sp.]